MEGQFPGRGPGRLWIPKAMRMTSIVPTGFRSVDGEPEARWRTSRGRVEGESLVRSRRPDERGPTATTRRSTQARIQGVGRRFGLARPRSAGQPSRHRDSDDGEVRARTPGSEFRSGMSRRRPARLMAVARRLHGRVLRRLSCAVAFLVALQALTVKRACMGARLAMQNARCGPMVACKVLSSKIAMPGGCRRKWVEV